VLLGNGSDVPTATALSGDVTIDSSGVTAIGSGVIVNADVSGTAAIAGSKIAPDFGAQNVLTTGTITGGNLNVTGTAVPTTGAFRPATNVLAFATNGLERARISPGGALLIGSTTAPTGAGSGAVVAQDRIVINSLNAGLSQIITGSTGSVTGATGTVVFKFKNSTPAFARTAFVKLTIGQRSSSNTPSSSPAAEYAFQLHSTTAGVCTLNQATTIFEYTYVRATHFSFADLGTAECTVTLTNPTAGAVASAYKVELLAQEGFWTLDTVTTT
jgi:hypothetical protein